MSLFISSVFTYDEDAGNYIQAVETADAQALEPATRKAINNFVIGCKQDGIWTAIKASCILAGARTRLGALTPLVGTAPDSFNFVDANYNRKTGLVGDGSTKYLDSNRNNNTDPQDNKHVGVYVSSGASDASGAHIGAGGNVSGSTTIDYAGAIIRVRNNSVTATATTSPDNQTGFIGSSRAGSTEYTYRIAGAINIASVTSQPPRNENIEVFARGRGNLLYGNARLAFYSIGESLDIALLDARVTDLINAFAVTIP